MIAFYQIHAPENTSTSSINLKYSKIRFFAAGGFHWLRLWVSESAVVDAIFCVIDGVGPSSRALGRCIVSARKCSVCKMIFGERPGFYKIAECTGLGILGFRFGFLRISRSITCEDVDALSCMSLHNVVHRPLIERNAFRKYHITLRIHL